MDTTTLVDGLIAVLLLGGAGFALIGSIGLVRLPDIYARLHGPTKSTTMGVGGVLIASMLFFWTRGEFSIHEMLITVFLVFTAPVSAHLIARAALHRKCKSLAAVPRDDDALAAGASGPADPPERRPEFEAQPESGVADRGRTSLT